MLLEGKKIAKEFLVKVVTVWRAQPWPPRICFVQVFDRFLTSLMDRMIKTFFCPHDLCLFSGDVIGSSEINSHQTCQKPVKTCTKLLRGGRDWTRKTVTVFSKKTNNCLFSPDVMTAMLVY